MAETISPQAEESPLTSYSMKNEIKYERDSKIHYITYYLKKICTIYHHIDHLFYWCRIGKKERIGIQVFRVVRYYQ
jgi:hypothetical protein